MTKKGKDNQGYVEHMLECIFTRARAILSRLSTNSLPITRCESSPRLINTLISINAPAFVPGVDYSDHRNYWAHDYPAVMITDTAFYRNHNYHTKTDTFDSLNYEKMAEVINGVFELIKNIEPTD